MDSSEGAKALKSPCFVENLFKQIVGSGKTRAHNHDRRLEVGGYSVSFTIERGNEGISSDLLDLHERSIERAGALEIDRRRGVVPRWSSRPQRS